MKKINLESFKNIHFIGIGGIGMSAIARMFLLDGKKVSGSDLSSSQITAELEKLGAKIFIGQKAENLDIANRDGEKIDLIIYTIAIKEDNLELVEAKRAGFQMLSYPEVLGIISADKFTIAVAGTHGKTTTTGMIAKIMIDAGLDPTVIIGSLLKDTKEQNASNFIAGRSKYFLTEACEYKRSFLEISPKVAVITNIDDDHLDYYKDLEGVQSGFHDFAKKLPKDGVLITSLSQKKIVPVTSDLSSTVLDYSAILDDKIPELRIPGEHMRENAKAALAVAEVLGISESQAKKSLADFAGTWRRFEYLGMTKNGTEVIDDYAHHPTEIKATLKGAREKFSGKKITVVFQPHLYSRTKEHLDEFAHSFENADEVIIAPIYAAREPIDPDVSETVLAEALCKAGVKGSAGESLEYIADELRKRLGPGDILITMGAGDVNKVAIAVLQ